MEHEQIHSIRDICLRFNVTRMTVYNWIKSGKLQAMKTGMGSVRITEASVQKFIEDSRTFTPVDPNK